MLELFSTLSLVISAILAGFVVWIAWRELGGSRKIAQATFVRDFTKNFMQPQTKFFYALCENNALQFKTRPINVKSKELFPYFTFNKETVKKIELMVPEEFRKNNQISFRVADDIMLVYLEDIGLFLEEGLVTEKMMYESWGYCIEIVWEDKAIQEFLEWWKMNKVSDTYEKFELAYDKCKEFETRKKVNS